MLRILHCLLTFPPFIFYVLIKIGPFVLVLIQKHIVYENKRSLLCVSIMTFVLNRWSTYAPLTWPAAEFSNVGLTIRQSWEWLLFCHTYCWVTLDKYSFPSASTFHLKRYRPVSTQPVELGGINGKHTLKPQVHPWHTVNLPQGSEITIICY